MPDVQPSHVRVVRSAAQIVNDAVNDALTRGLTVSSAPDLGVICTSTHAPTWERDPRRETVSPLGAVLLIEQPQISDSTPALISALGVTWRWLEGFDDGCAKAAAADTTGKLDALWYADGYAVGGETRALLHRRTGVPVARDHAEVTEPCGPPPGAIPDPSLIQRLLSTLTIAEALEAVASTVPGRAGLTDETKADAVEDLQDVAASFRAMGL